MKKHKKPKFKLGDIVCFLEDDDNAFHFNPVNKVISIGKIETIHIYTGEELGYNPAKQSKPTPYHPSKNNKIVYGIAGFDIMLDEKDIELYKQ